MLDSKHSSCFLNSFPMVTPMILPKSFCRLLLVPIFCCLFSGPSYGWELRDPSGPFDAEMALSIRQWRMMHNWELSTLLTGKQQTTFDCLVRGILNWAYTRGNTFSRDDFLNCFNGKDESVLVIPYPNGGVGLVVRGAYIRVELDTSRPELAEMESSGLWPDEGRWYAEIGCSTHSQIFYFLAATRSNDSLTANQAVPCTPVP